MHDADEQKTMNASSLTGEGGVDAQSERLSAADCWCGSSSFAEFGPDYLKCVTCGTLVSQRGLVSEELQVVDDEIDYYGKKYWLTHQESDYSYPGFGSRIRADLPERNLHWLKALLKYSLPPGRVVELGCAHGSFVGMMTRAGYTASGVEMSPWIVNYAREAFGIDVQVGPVERLSLVPGSLDVIAMMDVMEHLADPVSTMRHCLDLLKPEGFLLVQMPNFEEERSFDELVSTNAPFLQQLKSDEHLYLYSQRATGEFFRRLGAQYIAFEPAIFAHYDMFFVVSRAPLRENSQQEIERALMSTPNGRFVLAMLDMKDRYDLASQLQEQAAVRDQELHRQFILADELANARNLALAQLGEMRGHFEASESDREKRYEVIVRQGAEISSLHGEVDRRLKELNVLYAEIDELKKSGQVLEAELADIRGQFALVEKDREDRLEVIIKQGHQISELQAEVDRRLKELNAAYAGQR